MLSESECVKQNKTSEFSPVGLATCLKRAVGRLIPLSYIDRTNNV